MRNYRFSKITIFEKLPFLRNYNFLEIADFQKLPFLRNYRFSEITVFAKLPFLRNYRFFYLYIYTAEELVWGNYNFSTATKMIGHPIRVRMGTTLVCETTVFCEITVSEKLPFLRNYGFFYLYIYSAEELVGCSYYFSSATEMIAYLIRERMGTILFWDITVFAKIPFLRNFRFF